MHSGPAVWIDAGRHAVTSSLRQLAPNDRVLDRIQVARGFTPYQHTSILRTVLDDLPAEAPSLVVLPAVDAQYRADDVRGETGQDMLLAALAEIARLGRDTGVPMLMTRETVDEFSEPVAALATAEIAYTETPFGPRFTSDDWETLVYELDSEWVQTTITFWNEVLAEREPLYRASAATGAAGGLTIGAD